MPELPEVELASRVARRVTRGRRIIAVHVLHPSQRRALPTRAARSLEGEQVVRVRRRAKYQVLELSSGRSLVVHFRLSGDWVPLEPKQVMPAHARVVMAFDDGTSLVLSDPRALSAVVLIPVGIDPLPALGPEATSARFDARHLAKATAKRRLPIKTFLLDQRLVAGVGNIYASEGLWFARVDPRRDARSLARDECQRVVAGIKRVMQKALRAPGRYYEEGVAHLRFNVYDREGKGCRRCRTGIRRVVQGARSTYFCPSCQR